MPILKYSATNRQGRFGYDLPVPAADIQGTQKRDEGGPGTGAGRHETALHAVPRGCVAHGDGIGNIYRWENTIGPLETRKPQRNLWGYQQSFGLGYFEYFQFCEDIDAEPVPVVAAGVPCQNSAHHGCVIGGQQGGIPMEEMDAYIQSVLNLIESPMEMLSRNGAEKEPRQVTRNRLT